MWLEDDAWSRMSIRNTARSGKFSSDRAIREYCDEIWGVAVDADDINEALRIRAWGGTGDSVRWVATVRTTEVLYK